MGDVLADDRALFVGQGIHQPEAPAELYKKDLVGTPEDLASQFRWAEYLTAPAFYEKKLASFCKNTKNVLNLDTQEVIHNLEAARALTTPFFDIFQAPPDAPLMNYHDPLHSQITEIVGVKLFLGALSGLTKDSSYAAYFKSHPDLAGQLVKTVSAAFALHELDDWWKRKQNFEEIPSTIKTSLTSAIQKMGINTADLNRFVGLDDYQLKREKSVEKVFNGTYDKLCFEQGNTVSSVFESLTDAPELQKEIVTAIARSIRAADFMQILNPAYLQRANLIGKDGASLNNDSCMGTIALAREMQYYRPKALGYAGWQKEGSPTPEIDWTKVSIGKDFFNKLAYPNIDAGIHYLVIFDPDEYGRATDILDAIKKGVAATSRY